MNEDRQQFRRRIRKVLEQIGTEYLAYNEDEYWMIQSSYEYIEYYAYTNQLFNTSIALPLARGLHNGTYRKSTVEKEGERYRLPYVIHCLMVCRMLANLPIPISMEEKDILLAAALCHDMIEDIAFSKGGTELMTDFGLDSRVYEVVKLVSKRKDFTPEEEKAHFHGIEMNPLALMVKLSDRGHNIEDLYNMSTAKVHEYIDETRRFFLPMCEYGLTNYPEIGTTIEILQNKLLSLTKVAEVMVDRYGEREQELEEQLKQLKEENENLRKEWKALWEE